MRPQDEQTRLAQIHRTAIADDFFYEISRRGVLASQVLSRSRTPSVAQARAAVMTLIRDRLGWSYPEIGAFFDRDHSTVMAQIRAHRERVGLPIPPGPMPTIPDLDVPR